MATLPLGYGVLCIQSEATDGSTVFIDSSPSSVVINKSGSIQHTTDSAKYGISSIVSFGSSDYLIIPYYLFINIDLWVNIGSYGSGGYIYYGDSQNYLKIESNGTVTFKHQNKSITSLSPLSLNIWNHIYCGHTQSTVVNSYECSPYYGYGVFSYTTVLTQTVSLGINGTVATSTGSIVSNTLMCDGTNINAGLTTPTEIKICQFPGFYEEIRVFTGSIITSDFLPFGTPYPSYTSFTISGLVKEGLNLVPRVIRVYNRTSGELLKSGSSDANGVFLINELPNNQECYVVCLDDDAGTQYNALIQDRVIPQLGV